MSNYFNKKAEGTQVTGEKVYVSGLAEVQLKHDLLFDVQLFYDAELSNAVALSLFSLTDGYTDTDGATYYNAISLDSSLYSSYDFLYATYKSKADIVEAEDMNNKLDHIYTYECGETLSTYEAVELKNGKIWHVNLLVESEVDKTLGITLEDGVENQEIQVLLNGEYTNQEWSWNVNLPIYINANGVLSQTEPAEGFTYIIAIPTSPISIKMFHNKEQIQSDWDEVDVDSLAYINNKPDIPDELSDLSEDETHRVVTDTEKTNWNSAYSKEHTHDNKSDLDNVSGTNTGDQVSSDFTHNDLTGINDGPDYQHLTSANKTDLTDAGDTTLHYHATDRDRTNHTGTQTADTISDFDTEVSGNTDVAANTAARHEAVTVTDSSDIDFTLAGQDITASIKAGSIDEAKLDTSVNNSLNLADSSVQPNDDISVLNNDANYVSGNAEIVSATKTKVTYDAKGLVTAGEDATTADIADSTNRRYVTDAEKTVIGITSGTNTGDQDLSNHPTLVNDTNGNFLVKGGKNYPISNVELDNLTADYKAAGNTKPYLSFENPSEDQMVDLDVTPITWINELGVYGNFERDSNSDGLADGLTIDSGITSYTQNVDTVYGTYSQELTRTASGGQVSFETAILNESDVYFVSGYTKVTSKSTTDWSVLGYIGADLFFNSNDFADDSEWNKTLAVVTKDGDARDYLRIKLNDPTQMVAKIDGWQIFNLTKMGPLPPELATHFGKTNFADLTVAEVEEIAPDYVDSVQTVGYKFGNDSPCEVVNKGRNLWENISADDYDINTASSLIDNNRRIEFTTTASSQGIKPITPNGNGMVSLKPNTNYSLTVSGKCAVVVYDTADGTKIFGYANADVTSSYSFETADSTEYQFLVYNRSAGAGTYWINYIQLEEGTTATEYQPPKSYTETLPELWSMFGIEDTPYSKKFKRVKLLDAVQSGGDIDWSWHTGAPSECLVINTQEDSPNYGENARIRMYSTESLDWIENDDVEVVYNEHYLEFDGTNDYILSTNNLGIIGNAEFTMECKFKLNKIPNAFASVMGNNSTDTINRGLSLTLYEGIPAIDFWENRFRGISPLQVGRIYTVSVTKTPGLISSTSKIYLDGVEIEGELEGTDGIPNISDAKILIGALKIGIPNFAFPGEIYEVRYWNTVRTQEEIQENMDKVLSGNETGLVAYYKFNESGTTLKDYAGSNDGTIYGATWHDTEFDNTVETYSAKPALSFDGVDDYVSIPVQLPQSGTVEISFSLKRKNVLQQIFSHYNSGNRFYLAATPTGGLSFQETATTAVELIASVELGHVYTVKIDYTAGSSYDIYVDDVLVIENEPMEAKVFKTGVTVGRSNASSDYFAKMNLYGLKITDNADYTLEEGTGNTLIDHSGNGNDGTINGATWTTGLVSNPADEIELYQNPEPKLLIEHGKNAIFGDNIFLNFETTYDQYELENIIREEKNKTPTLEENEDGIFALTRNGDKIPLGSTNLPENPETRWKGYSMVNLESELPLQKVQGKGYFNSFVNLLGTDGDFEVDSNSDGLADIITQTSNAQNFSLSSDSLFGSYSQYCEYTGSSNGYIAITDYRDYFDAVDGDIFYASVFGKADKIVQLSMRSGDYDTDTGTVSIANGKWVRVSLLHQFKTVVADAKMTLATSDTSGTKYDGLTIINLTEKGELPPSMQAEYGVTRWDMLSKTQLDEIIGYENTITGYDDDFADITITNSDADFSDSQSIPRCFGYAGVYDEIDFKTGEITKYWKKETGVSTESDGTFSVTDDDYKTSSVLIVIDESSGDVETLQELDSSFLSDTVTVIYQTTTPTTENLAAYKGIRLVNGTNNILADNMFIDARGTLNQRAIELMMTEEI